MGRFYRTSKPQNIEYMYSLPEEYMFGAVQQASQDIDQNQAALFDIYGKLELNALQKDKQRADEILNNYEQSVNQLSTELQEDPLSFRKRTPDIMRLSRDLHKDFTRGESAEIQSNYNSYAEWQKALDEKVKKGDVSPDWASKLRSYNLGNFEGTNYNPATGNYNSINLEQAAPYVDYMGAMREAADKVQPFITATADSDTTGEYILEWGGKTETVGKDRILDVIQNEFLSNQKIQDYVKQGSRIGALSGFYNLDEQGQLDSFVSPYIEKTYKDAQGRKRTKYEANPASALGPVFDSLINTFAYNNVTSAYERVKNKPGSRGTTSIGTGGFAVDKKTGKISKPVYPDIDTSGNAEQTPSRQVQTTISELRDTTLHNSMINDAGKSLLESLPSIFDRMDIEDTDDIINTLTNELSKGVAGIDGIKAQLESLKDNYNINSIDMKNIDDAVSQIEEMKIEANNLEVRHNIYEDLAAKTGVPADSIYTNPDLQTATMDLTTTFGGYYYADGELFNKELERLQKERYQGIDDISNDPIVLLEQNGEYKATQMSKDNLLRQDFLYQKRKTDAERQASGDTDSPTPNARNKSGSTGARITMPGSSDSSDKKSPLNARKEIKLGKMSRIVDDVPYTFTDENGVQRSQVLVQPFQIQVENTEGTNVSILIPNSDVNSEVMNKITAEYAPQRDMENRIKSINTQLAAAKEFAKRKNTELDLKDADVFELIDGFTYVPPMNERSNGKIIINDGENVVIATQTNSGKYLVKDENGQWVENTGFVVEAYKNAMYKITE